VEASAVALGEWLRVNAGWGGRAAHRWL